MPATKTHFWAKTRQFWTKSDYRDLNTLASVIERLEDLWIWWDGMDFRTDNWEVIPTKEDLEAYEKAKKDFDNWVNITEIDFDKIKTPEDFRKSLFA